MYYIKYDSNFNLCDYPLIPALLVSFASIKLGIQGTNSLDQFGKNNPLLNDRTLLIILDPNVLRAVVPNAG